MAFTSTEIQSIYRKRARAYDLTANSYYLIGFRELRYRRLAIEALDLRPGQTVVELGCGTGLNFPLIQERIGPEGRLIGVDFTDAMLREARTRIERHGWQNVELVRSAIDTFEFPAVDRIISTFALTLVPTFDAVIERARAVLPSDGRFVVLDFREPERAPRWLVRFASLITRPFAVTIDLADRHPWERLDHAFSETHYTSLYFGFAYIATGIVSR